MANSSHPIVSASPTTLGRQWKKRIKRAETKRKRGMPDAAELRALYTTVYEQREKWGVSIPIGRSLVNQIVGDTYLRNPDPYIQLSSASASHDPYFEHKLRDLAKMNVELTNLKWVMQQGMIVNAFACPAATWTELVQEDHYEPPRRPSAEMNVAAPDDENDEEDQQLVVDRQELKQRFLYPWEFLIDPDCNEWDLSTAKWIAIQYFMTFAQIEKSEIFGAKEKAKLISFLQNQPPRRTEDSIGIDGYSAYDEKSDDYRGGYLWDVWSMAESIRVHLPVGGDFHVGKQDWPDNWRAAKKYPLTVIAFPDEWQPLDERGNGGFYGLPALRKVRSPLENLPRLEAVYLDTVTNKIRKYLSPEGLLTNPAKTEVQSDKNRQWIDVDLATLIKKYNLSELEITQLDLNRLIVRLNQDDQKDVAQALEAIQHQLQLAFMLLEVGPGERAGIPPTKSATDSLGIQQGLADRRERRIEAAADIADEIVLKQFIALKSATQPVRYLRAVGINQTMWTDFPAEDLWDIDLIVKHHVGTSRPPDRATIKAERREIFTITAPVLQAIGRHNKVFDMLAWLIEPYDEEFATRLVDSGLDEMAQEMELMLDLANNVPKIHADPRFAAQLLDKLSKFLNEYLSDAQHQQVAHRAMQLVGGGGTAPGQQGMGSLPAAKSQGAKEFAAGAARSGAVGGRG